MAWYTAPSLVTLRNELNRAHPNRDRSSDGFVGDTAHAARKSDHNPDYSAGGVVRAGDFDKDGINTDRLLDIARRDNRVEYIIWRSRIYTRSNGFRAAVYRGSNPHDKHMHISLRHTKDAENPRPWGYTGGGAPAPPPPPPPGRESNEVIARQVIQGRWGSGEDRKRRLRAAGYDPVAVQNEVNRILRGGGAPPPPPPPGKSVEQIAREVIAGHWGNGSARSQRLQNAGHSPTAVQAEVNRILRGGSPSPTRLSVQVLAEQVIRGQWGSGNDRRQRLTAAGYDYNAVQAEVNRRL